MKGIAKMNIWVVTTLLVLLSSTYLVTGHGDEPHATAFEGEPYSNDGCDVTRGCFDCRTNFASCEVNVAWEPDSHDNVVKFTLWGTKVADNAHVSIGITSTSNMFSADVYSCLSDDTGLVMSRSWNPSSGRSTEQRPLKGVFDQVVSEVNGEIRCQFTRNMSLADGDAEFQDISGNTSYFLIFSAGVAGGGNGFGHSGGSNRGLSPAFILSQTFTGAPAEDTTSYKPATFPLATPIPGLQEPYSNDGCDVTRGCFDCRTSLSGCEVNVAWEPDSHENVVNFTLWGTKVADNAHVSVGITSTSDMFSADVYSCVSDDTGMVMSRSWNPSSGRTTEQRSLKGVFDQVVSEVNGEIRCQFTRNMSLADGDAEFQDISGNTSYFLILSAGSAGGGNGFGHSGGSNRGLSGAVILSQTIAAAPLEDTAYLMKLHGCMMVIAWIGLASVGLTMARFFKPMWPDSKLCGEKVWFSIHRSCMVLALLCTIVGFIVIFVHVGSFLELGEGADSRRRFSHAVLGCIVTSLAIINPIMAIFRPHPGTPKRPIFNWAHWAVGLTALILSFATVGLALVPIPFGSGGNMLPNLESYTFWVLIGFGVFMFVMWIIFEVLRCATDSEGRTNDIPLSAKNETVQAPDNSGPGAYYEREAHSRSQTTREGSMLKTILLFIFSLGAVFSVAFLIITIAIA